jgi:AraC family transcriptional regulator
MPTHRGAIAELGLTKQTKIAGFSISQFSQPPERRLPWHEHADASICFVVSGAYAERIGRQTWDCTPHAMVFKPAGVQHADQFGRIGATCLLIEIAPGRLQTTGPCGDVTLAPSVARNARLAALGHQIHGEVVAGDQFSALAIEGLVLEVLAEGSRALTEAPTPRPPRWLRQARDLIHESSPELITLSSIARSVGIHPSHLARTFRKHYRRSIGDYVRRLRVERAAGLLAESAASIAQISLRSGFFDQSHFARVFKRHTGLTPAQYRAAFRARTSRTMPHQMS